MLHLEKLALELDLWSSFTGSIALEIASNCSAAQPKHDWQSASAITQVEEDHKLVEHIYDSRS